MKEINTLIPGRHIPLSKSLLAIAGQVYSHINHGYVSIDELTNTLKKIDDPISKNINFTTVMLSIVVLYSINQIEMKNGLVRKINHETN